MTTPAESEPRLQTQRPTIWQLAVPSIMSNLMFSMVAMVQTKFVGSLGASAVAAVGAGQRVFFALQAVFTAIGGGTTALVARSCGAGQHEEAGRTTITALVVGATAGAIITLVGMLFSRQI